MRRHSPTSKTTSKYRSIEASIGEVGIIEPLVVFPHGKTDAKYMLLDGHTRYEILIEKGVQSVDCLIALDDEAFTYNHKVNRLSPIQEHFMILKAVKQGVTEEAIAAALNINVAKIKEKRDLLVGICPEAVKLLKNRRANAGTIRQLRKVKPMRQIEMAELMCASSNFTVPYAKCLVAATSQEELIESEQAKQVDGLSLDDMARMEREMESISGDFRQIEESYGKNILNLVIVNGYVKKLLNNAAVVRFLAGNLSRVSHPVSANDGIAIFERFD